MNDIKHIKFCIEKLDKLYDIFYDADGKYRRKWEKKTVNLSDHCKGCVGTDLWGLFDVTRDRTFIYIERCKRIQALRVYGDSQLGYKYVQYVVGQGVYLVTLDGVFICLSKPRTLPSKEVAWSENYVEATFWKWYRYNRERIRSYSLVVQGFLSLLGLSFRDREFIAPFIAVSLDRVYSEHFSIEVVRDFVEVVGMYVEVVGENLETLVKVEDTSGKVLIVAQDEKTFEKYFLEKIRS